MNTEQIGGDPLDAEELLLSARVDAAAQQRRRRSWATEEALVDLTLDAALLGSIGEDASLQVAGAHVVTGQIRAVGVDVVEVVAPTRIHWVALASVLAISSGRATRGVDAERGRSHLADLVQDLVETGRGVTALLTTSATFHGFPVAAGETLVLQTDEPRRQFFTISWGAVAAIVLERPAGD